MKKLILFLLFTLLLVSCSIPLLKPYNFASNPFTDKIWISKEETDTINFSVIADSHFGRKNTSTYNESYYSYLEENSVPFVLHLGDFTDTGVITEEDEEFVSKVKSLTTLKRMFITLGNHDRHTYDSRWDGSDETYTSAACYYYGTRDGRPLLAIYKIDTSSDTIGWKQFGHLEEALEKETAVYRIIVTHENVAIGNRLSPTMVIFGLSSDECNRLYALMEKYKVGLILSGHNHLGNIEYHLSDTIGELNLAAYHRKVTKPVQYESMGYWYGFTLTGDGKVRLDGYYAETGEKNTTFHFSLPEN